MPRIRINDAMTLYNANETGRALPPPWIRVNKMPLRFVAPAFGMENLRELRNANTGEVLKKNVLPRWYSSGGLSAAMRGDMPGRMGELARNVHWSGEARFQFLRKPVFPNITQFTRTNAVLSFAPTAAIDLYSSYDRGTGSINWRQFGINSAKNQSGNALAVVAGMAAP